MAEHVAHGSWQFWLQVWAEVKKKPLRHDKQPDAVHVRQLIEHCKHVLPLR